jgi:hypothetical protein
MDIKPYIPLIIAIFTTFVALFGFWFTYVQKYAASKEEVANSVKTLILRIVFGLAAVLVVAVMAVTFLGSGPITRGELFNVVLCSGDCVVVITLFLIAKVVQPQIKTLHEYVAKSRETELQLLELIFHSAIRAGYLSEPEIAKAVVAIKDLQEARQTISNIRQQKKL